MIFQRGMRKTTNQELICIHIKYLQSINKSMGIQGKSMRYLGKLLSRVVTDLSLAMPSVNQMWRFSHQKLQFLRDFPASHI